jgi:hypothetical protein
VRKQKRPVQRPGRKWGEEMRFLTKGTAEHPHGDHSGPSLVITLASSRKTLQNSFFFFFFFHNIAEPQLSAKKQTGMKDIVVAEHEVLGGRT